MNSSFLDFLDLTLASGIALLGAQWKDNHARYVIGRQSSDGGFPGRQGGSDPYYTDFAVRTLVLLGKTEGLKRAAGYARGLKAEPRDLVDCFSRLNLARLLKLRIDTGAVRKQLERQQLAGGGFARKNAVDVSAYNTFLAALCCEMLGEAFPAPDRADRAVAGLR